MHNSPLRRPAFLLVVLILLTACNLPSPTPEGQPQQQNNEVGPSATPPPPQEPTEPPPPTETQTPAPPTETPTPTPTEGPNFGAASIYSVGHLPGNRLLVTLEIPGGVEGTYTATSATSNQVCEVLPEYPDRLYCTGPEPFQNYTNQSAIFRLFVEGQFEPVFETEFNIPPQPTPTPTETKEPTATP